MRFKTKKDYYSNQFYSYFIDGVNEEELLYNNHNIQMDYCFYMNRDFNEFVYNYELVKSILYDNKQKLNNLDKKIYYKMLKLAQCYKNYQKKQSMLLKESTQRIFESNCSENIKFLAGYRYHDCSIININYKEKYLSIEYDDFSWNRHTRYIFNIKDFIHNISIENIKEFEVVYEEIIAVPAESIFEYNLLLRKWGDLSENNQIEEISILFIDLISVEHTQL